MAKETGFQADSIQGVLFLMHNQKQDDALELWSELFPGERPDEFHRKANSPSLNSSAGGERGDFHVTINTQVRRVDVIISKLPQINSIELGPPRVSDVYYGVRVLVDILNKIVDRFKVVRVAVVLDLAKTVASGDETDVILRNLPGFPFPANSLDINVQFNVRRAFDFAGEIEMNRLCAVTSGQVGFMMGPRMAESAPMRMVPYVGFKIDVNSVPQILLPQEFVARAVDEVAAECIAIFNEGIERLVR